MKTVIYEAKGLVLGNLWGGGKGCYSTIVLKNKYIDALIEEAKKCLNDGSLDSGMDFESLTGAILNITTITTVKIDGKPFKNKESVIAYIGELTDEETDFLRDCFFNQERSYE